MTPPGSGSHRRRTHAVAILQLLREDPVRDGGQVAHARTHVRFGEVVELVKDMLYPFSPSRVFLPAGNEGQIAGLLADGYAMVPA